LGCLLLKKGERLEAAKVFKRGAQVREFMLCGASSGSCTQHDGLIFHDLILASKMWRL
jgi:hypothetical protein